MKRLTLILFVFSMISLSAFAKERMALVIGNSDYLNPLSNPVNDARDMAKLLGYLGFDVTLKVNADQMTMESTIQAFGEKLHENAVGLFYFSGHGVQHAGDNYLIPINSILRTSAAAHLRYKAVPADYVLGVMQNADNGLNIVILDACRDNPFKGFSKNLKQGLARMESAEGTLIAYATAPDTVAWIGEAGGRNSPYTKHLLRFMKQPHLPIESLLKKVRKAVIQETRYEETVQKPWYEASINEDFYFLKDFQTPTTPATQAPPVEEDTAQKIAELLNTCQFRFDNNWLTSGGSGTALACYQEVLNLDSNNWDASRGLINIENQYVKWAEMALENGKKAKARQYLASLLQVNPESPKLAVLEIRLETLTDSSYRYTDNGDGTVTDNRTGLVWLKNANCFGEQNWKEAKQSAANLGSGQCGLHDGSMQGMWRLPSKEEWEAMIDKEYGSLEKPGLSLSNATGTGKWKEDDAFSDVQTGYYWSSTTNATNVWAVNLENGNVLNGDKASAAYVWLVRGEY